MAAKKGNQYAKGNKGGRPTKYDPEYHPNKVYQLCLLNLTDEQMANVFEVATSTFDKWKVEYVEFSEAITRGKEEADAKIAESLFHRAFGYEHQETKFFQYQGEVIKVETVRHYPPDTEAAKFWLKNRHPKMWRDRKDHSFREEPTEKVLSEMDIEERRTLIKKFMMLDDEAGE